MLFFRDAFSLLDFFTLVAFFDVFLVGFLVPGVGFFRLTIFLERRYASSNIDPIPGLAVVLFDNINGRLTQRRANSIIEPLY